MQPDRPVRSEDPSGIEKVEEPATASGLKAAKEPESFLDRVRARMPALMPDELFQISDGNRVRVLDTPQVWGRDMTEAGMSGAADRVGLLAATIGSMVAGAERIVDIVTLDAPTGVFLREITAGLRAHADRDQPLLVRFMFGFVPVVGRVEDFRDELARLRAEELPNESVRVVLGQCYTMLGRWWNHAKIVAVDGAAAIVGGHNLWGDAYAGYPPVHDLSVRVDGPAAADSHRFAEFIWLNGGDYLDVWEIASTGEASKLKPGADRDRLTVPTETPRWRERQAGGRNRIMALGRAGGLGRGGYNASDVAKRTVISTARKTLRISQQDLLFSASAKPSEHLVCNWIADALVASSELVVAIVVSPLDASAAGIQFSWGSGARGTYDLLRDLVIERCESEEQAFPVLTRLEVAPFCFTAITELREGEDYHWPDVPKNLHVGRFNTSVMLPGIKNRPPAPANHAKFYAADEQVYYVGSDNLYPHNLAEFGYLVEGGSVREALDNYWEPIWRYSSPHGVGATYRRQAIAEQVLAAEAAHDEKL
jgi:murine toxin